MRIRPALVIPCDDRAIDLILSLQAHRASCGAGKLIGEAERIALGYASLRSLCEELEVVMPAGRAAPCEQDVLAFGQEQGYPIVLKRTGTYGGLGVRIARDAPQAARYWHELRLRPPTLWVAWRAAVERNYLPFFDHLRSLLKRGNPEISVQKFVEGAPANCSLAAWEGELLATFNVVALQTLRETGPATVVQVVDQPDMSKAASRIAQKLGVSGLWGLDFLIETTTGRAYLLEVNPRATPSGGLRFHGAANIVDSLARVLGAGRPPVAGGTLPAPAGRDGRVADRIAVHFPAEWSRDPSSPWLSYPHHNVPWSEPAFMRACLGTPYEDAGLVASARNRLKRWLGL